MKKKLKLRFERNKLCICGSGKKWKACGYLNNKLHQDSLKKPVSVKMAQMFKNAEVMTCLYPIKDQCKGGIVNAHSIQNNKILKKLSKNGMVKMVFPTPSTDPVEFTLSAKDISKNSATTFTGFCKFHDNLIFKEIEEKDYQIGSQKQDFLFAFRAYSKEAYLKILSNYVTSRAQIIDIDSALFVAGSELSIKDSIASYDRFKECFEQKKYDLIETKVIAFNEEYLFSVSSAINFLYDFEGNMKSQLQDLEKPASIFFITIFPQNGKTYVLLSYFAEFHDYYSFLEKQLISVNDDQKKILLTNLLANNCENIVFSDSLWSKLGKEGQELYTSGLKKHLEEGENPDTLKIDKGFNFFI